MTSTASDIPQYSAGKILFVWAAAALPMAILAWIVTPALIDHFGGGASVGFERMIALTAGLIWQFILVTILLYRETDSLRWSSVKDRLWLNAPSDPHTGQKRRRLWWWLVPVVLLTAFCDLQLRKVLVDWWVTAFPFFSEPPGADLGKFLGAPEARAQMIGNWPVFALFTITALFNTVLGEELLFRGLLLPRMSRVCGRWDWAANGLLFGLYHLHQPWGMLNSILKGMLLFALPTRRFRSAWFGIIAHSGQSLFLSFLLLGLVLGLG